MHIESNNGNDNGSNNDNGNDNGNDNDCNNDTNVNKKHTTTIKTNSTDNVDNECEQQH